MSTEITKEIIQIPLPVLITGVSAIFTSGLGLGGFLTRYQTIKKCESNHNEVNLEFENVSKERKDLETELEDAIRRLHERIDEVVEKISRLMEAVSHLKGKAGID